MHAALCHHYGVIRARDVIGHVTKLGALGTFPQQVPNRKQLAQFALHPLVSKIFSLKDVDRYPLTSMSHVTSSVT